MGQGQYSGDPERREDVFSAKAEAGSAPGSVAALAASPHTFHIPVMGTGFTIDTPLKVARYGITSVISLVDDVLIEQMRRLHSEREGEPYEEIGRDVPDARALRITAYLNLVDRLVQRHARRLQSGPFQPGSEITRYFELLPECDLKREYRRMLSAVDPGARADLQKSLRLKAQPGRADVNIMTKLDRGALRGVAASENLFSDAMSALRGYANSTQESAIVFSAGMNQRLYSYAAQFADFLPQAGRPPRKSIILKVSDYRSAEIQGKFLAKRGLWVYEYRVESGLNCGGHAFANKGYLMGPILEEFRRNKARLEESLRLLYRKALAEKGLDGGYVPGPFRITVQGGIGTYDEDRFLRDHFGADGTGWGTPFLLVPEATNVDDFHLEKLAQATERDVFLSDGSPLNVPFWMLRGSKSEEARIRRIKEGRPGSACIKGYLALNTEFSQAGTCRSSAAYQKLKRDQLSNAGLPADQLSALRENLDAKSCICHDLAGGATLKYGIDPKATTTVCCGPGIAYFSRIATLEEMVGHIYGRVSLIANPGRRHMFIEELRIYVEYFRKEIGQSALGIFEISQKYLQEFKQNMLSGIEYYHGLSLRLPETQRQAFLAELDRLKKEIEPLLSPQA